MEAAWHALVGGIVIVTMKTNKRNVTAESEKVCPWDALAVLLAIA